MMSLSRIVGLVLLAGLLMLTAACTSQAEKDPVLSAGAGGMEVFRPMVYTTFAQDANPDSIQLMLKNMSPGDAVKHAQFSFKTSEGKVTVSSNISLSAYGYKLARVIDRGSFSIYELQTSFKAEFVPIAGKEYSGKLAITEETKSIPMTRLLNSIILASGLTSGRGKIVQTSLEGANELVMKVVLEP